MLMQTRNFVKKITFPVEVPAAIVHGSKSTVSIHVIFSFEPTSNPKLLHESFEIKSTLDGLALQIV